MALSWLSLGAVRASASSRAAALQSLPIEEITTPEEAATWVAGGKQTKGALPLQTVLFDCALYSSRGRGYARYNEDAAILFSDRLGRAYSAVFDQAGGLGGRVRGAASELAARRTFEAFRAIAASAARSEPRASLGPAGGLAPPLTGLAASAARSEPKASGGPAGGLAPPFTGQSGPADVEARAQHEAIIQALEKAHVELVERAEGEVTTAIVAIAGPGSSVLVNSGDSGALHYDEHGKTKAMTTPHEYESPIAAGCLTHAVGLVPETAAPDSYAWELAKGDWLLLCTDGLLDSGLTDHEIGEVLASAQSAEAAVNKLCTRVLRSMTMLRAKPDNLSVLAIRAL